MNVKLNIQINGSAKWITNRKSICLFGRPGRVKIVSVELHTLPF